jgi:hypothetical protein
MTDEQKIISNKVGLLKLAQAFGNVSHACKVLRFSRGSFHRFEQLSDQGGELALQEISRRKPIVKNGVEESVERAVVACFQESKLLSASAESSGLVGEPDAPPRRRGRRGDAEKTANQWIPSRRNLCGPLRLGGESVVQKRSPGFVLVLVQRQQRGSA